MPKLPSILLVLATLLIAGCGGGGGGEDASSPLDEALRYLPADAPFAVAIDTDVEGDQYEAAGEIVERFPGGEGIVAGLRGQVEDQAGDFERLQQALGNEFVVGSTDADAFINESTEEDTSWIGVIQAKSRGALDDLLEREKPKADGEANGARLYEDDEGDTFAVKDDVLIVGGARGEVERALETREGDGGLTEEDFDAATDGIPQDALLRVYFDAEGLLDASPDAKDALKVEWLRALRTVAIGLSIERDEVTVDFEVDTDPEGLTDEDLPVATGGDAPQVLDRDGQISLALRDPAQVLEFAQAAAKAADEDAANGIEVVKGEIERRAKIDVDRDVLGQIEGDLAVTVDLDGKFGARAELKDPRTFERTIAKLSDALPTLAPEIGGEEVGFARPKAGEDFYAIATADGDQFVYGVVDGVFVLANDPTLAGTLATERTRSVPGAQGALVVSTNAERLAQSVLRQVRGTDFDLVERVGGAIVTRPLDELAGSVESSPEGLSGSFRLTLDG